MAQNKLGSFFLEGFFFAAQFAVFNWNNKYSTYDSNYLCTKERENVWSMRFSVKAVAMYSSKKSDFDSKNNDGGGKSAQFWLANS